MVVNSINFWLFFLIFLIPYFTLFRKFTKVQNTWLLIASYVFYGLADWKMLPLLAVVTVLYYVLGIVIAKNNSSNPKRASWLTTLGVVVGVGVLLYFKYFDFFITEFARLFNSIGIHVNVSSFNIIMPIGISFFIFKLMSYPIEVHRENIIPSRDLVQFAAYVSFFPTILSGPIDKPNTFLPQMAKSRYFCEDDFSEGIKRVIWGMFLKMCIADRLSPWTDAILNNYSHHNATSICLAAVLYMIQMYADFCGYSDMAIGVSRIMGFRVTENFKRPFFAQNIAEYWRRWHISLTSWITNYIFMPLNVAFRSWQPWGLYLATVINLVVIGAWHGANWTFVLFGLYHGLLLVIVTTLEKRRKKIEKEHNLKNNEIYKWSRRLLTFILCVIGALLFRSASATDFFATLGNLSRGFGRIYREGLIEMVVLGVPSILIMFFKEFKDEYKKNIHFMHSENTVVRIVSIVAIISYIIFMGALDGGQFIYFQF